MPVNMEISGVHMYDIAVGAEPGINFHQGRDANYLAGIFTCLRGALFFFGGEVPVQLWAVACVPATEDPPIALETGAWQHVLNSLCRFRKVVVGICWMSRGLCLPIAPMKPSSDFRTRAHGLRSSTLAVTLRGSARRRCG